MTAKDDVTYAIDRPLLDLIRRFIRSKYRRHQDDVEDIAHDVILRLINVRSPEKISASYVFAVTKNLIIDRSRADAARTRNSAENVLDNNFGNFDVGLDPERTLLGREQIEEVFSTLDQLSERTREIFLLYRVDGFSQREIASRFNISVSAVEKNIARAVMHLAMKVDLR